MGHVGMGWVMQGWGGSCRSGVGHVGVGWVIPGWGGMGHTGVGHAGLGGVNLDMPPSIKSDRTIIEVQGIESLTPKY